MVILKDDKRIVRNVRKQFLKVKGKLWILGKYKEPNKRAIIKLSDASANIISKNIDMRRAIFNAVTKGMKLCVIENGASSSIKLVKVLNWGIQYGSRGQNKFNPVTVKRFKRGGKYYTGVWVKGSRGMQHMQKYSYTKNNRISDIAKQEGLLIENKTFSNDY